MATIGHERPLMVTFQFTRLRTLAGYESLLNPPIRLQ